MEKIIDVKNLTVKYGRIEAVRNASFAVDRGDFVGLTGPNGAGKSTLAKAILGLVPIASGKISIFGEDRKVFRDFSKIGYLPQKQTRLNPIFPATVEEAVLSGLASSKKFPKMTDADDMEKVGEILKKLNISHLRYRKLSELSGGQQQRSMLARALATEPELLIFDEPSAALDPESRSHFFEIIKDLNETGGTTILLITHDTGYIGKYANKILYIDCKVHFFGSLKEFCPEGEFETCFHKNGSHVIWHQHE